MKNRIVKKIVTSLLCASMVMGMLSGCGNEANKSSEDTSKEVVKEESKEESKESSVVEESKKPEDYPTLRVFAPDVAGTDNKLVSETLSEYTREVIGANIEIVQFDADYNNKIGMMLATNEQMDIIIDASDHFNLLAGQNAFYDISDFVENSELPNILNEEYWNAVTKNGAIYGVPTLKDMTECWGYLFPTEALTASGLKVEDLKTPADFEPILAALKDMGRQGYQTKPGAVFWASHMRSVMNHVHADYGFRDGESECVAYYMSDEFEEYARLMRSWYEKGYIAEDVLTLEKYEDTGEKVGIQAKNGVRESAELSAEKQYGIDMTLVPVTDRYVAYNAGLGAVSCVASKSENPELAFEFIELLYTDAYVKNTFTWGVEGVHYTKTGDNRIERPENVKEMYYNQNWRSGNNFLSYLLPSEADNHYEALAQENASGKALNTTGFMPDLTPVQAEIAACTAAKTEYAYPLLCGAVDVDEYLPKLHAALKEAGVEKVTAELTRQFQEWEASK